MSNRKEKKEDNREGTQTSKHPNGYPKLEVFEKAATKKRRSQPSKFTTALNYRNENMKMSGNEVKIRMIRAHKIIRRWRTNDFHWKRSMASLSRRLAQNRVAAPLRREDNESDCSHSRQE